MTRSTLLMLALASFVALAPLALAQESETKPSEEPQDGGNAWVEDCPPDMMCAYSAPSEGVDCRDDANATREECQECKDCVTSHQGSEPTAPSDCGGEVCAYGSPDDPAASGPADGGSTCMDGAQENETCRDDVYYMTPPRGPDGCEYCRGDDAAQDDVVQTPEGAEGGITSVREESQPQKESQVPAPLVALAIVGAGAAAILVARRK